VPYLLNFSRSGAPKGVPPHDYAVRLLRLGLWAIGRRAPNREYLAPGDRVLVYVGVPDRSFIANATLTSAVHEWTAAEKARYPDAQPQGITLGSVEVWDRPIAIQAVWPRMSGAGRNPNAVFLAGVLRLTDEDYQLALDARQRGSA
jgi:hypothetical protein